MNIDHMRTLLQRLVGSWTTEATHPALPGTTVRGTAIIEWLEGEHFLIQRARNDHPDFPDSIAIIGVTASDRVDDGARSVGDAREGALRMHYYDSRGVYREYATRIDEATLRFERLAPGFSQRFTGKLTRDSIDGLWQLSEDEQSWQDDLKIVFRRSGG